MRFRFNQDAIYWPPMGVDEFTRPVYGPPEELRCRWESKTTQTIGPDGVDVTVSGVVWPERPLAVKGLLMLGTLEEAEEITGSPADDPRTLEIVNTGEVPNLKATQKLFQAFVR